LLVMFFCLAASASLNAENELPPVSWYDVPDWKHIPGGSVTLSNDGNWLAYWYSPNNGNSQLVLQHTVDTTKKVFEIGETSRGANAIQFNESSDHLAFIVFPTQEEKKKAPRDNPPQNDVRLIDLGSMEEKVFENVKDFSFSGENPKWLAVHLTTPEPSNDEDAGSGTDLLLYNLQSSNQLSFGNVSDYSFDKKGNWLAWLIDTYGKSGNGVHFRNMNTGTVIPAESGKAKYRYLNWTDEGEGLAVLKGKEDENREDMLYSVVAFRDFENAPVKVEYDPHKDEQFPEKMTISPNLAPRWSENMETLFFGIHEAERKQNGDTEETEEETGEERATLEESEEEKPEVVIWHWLDDRLQSVQQRQENRDRRFSYLSAYHLNEERFVQLADDNIRSVDVAPKDNFALGTDVTDYQLKAGLSGRSYADVYSIDVSTGEKELILEEHRMLGGLRPSPGEEVFLFYREGDYYTYNLKTGEKINITENLPTHFTDDTFDRNVKFPPTPAWGWTSDSKYTLIRDNWDLWKISSDGKEFENLTQNGAENKWRYRYHFRLDPGEEGIDLSKPLYLSVFDDTNKQTGIARIDNGEAGAKILMMDDAVYGNLNKVEDEDIFYFTRQTSTDPPDYYISREKNLTGAEKVTEIYPESENFALSPGSRLISFVSDKGDTLDAALFLPAGYEEGEKYPTVVYIYERLTQGLNSYTRPSIPGGGFNREMYTSNGYAVLMPDIVYSSNDPGMSSVWCVLPAVDAAVETGVVDPDNIGIHGHSWGGYQTSFLITQTDIFKAAVAGAPLTNMISMYSLIYWNTGSTNQPIFESSQGRFEGGYWDHWEAYKRNSPVYYAENVETPLLLMHNDEDGAVDFTQGIEYYNTLRRLRKPVVMLQYPGENHSLAKTPNRIDYAFRMMEFMDHYLKGADAPGWLEDGIPLLEMENHLKERPAILDR